VKRATLLTLCLLLGAVWSPSRSTIHHVGGQEPDYNLIQQAFEDDNVISGDTIQVHRGQYQEAVDFNGKSVLLHGGEDLDVPEPDSVLIDASNLDTTVVTIASGETQAEIRGFTLKNGQAEKGGGMFISTSPVIQKIIVRNNSASKGAGIYCQVRGPVIRDVTIRDNSSSNHGGGIYIADLLPDSTVTIDSCKIVNNTSSTKGGGVASVSQYGNVVITETVLDSNYVYSDVTTSKIIDNTIQYNRASKGGGIGVYKDEEWPSPTIKDNLIDHNEATKGGGIYLIRYSGLISGNTIKSNEANRGGALYHSTGSATITENFMDSNSAPTDSVDGVFIGGNASLTVCTTNVIINHTWNLHYAGGFTLNAEKNHWRTIDTDSVDAHIGTGAATDTVDFNPIMYSGHVPYNSVCSTDVIVNADIWVPTSTKLTIAPAKSMKFLTSDDSTAGDDTSRCELIVNGFLDATGTSSNRITFTSNLLLGSSGDWYGIKFNNSSNDSSTVEYCDIKYGYYGIDCDSASPSIEHNRLWQCGHIGFNIVYSEPDLNYNSCRYSWIGIRCFGSYDPTAILDSDTCKNCTYGMYFISSSSPTVTEGIFKDNDYGIYCNNQCSPDISQSELCSNDLDGLYCHDHSSPILSKRDRPIGYPDGGYNEMYQNDSFAVYCDLSSYPHLGGKYAGGYGWGNNSIYLNGSYEIYNANSSGTIMAERNYWGAPWGPSPGDFYGSVDYTPYLRFPPPEPLSKGSVAGGEDPPGSGKSEAAYYNEIGTSYWFQGHYDVAKDTFEYVLSNYPGSEEAAYALSHILWCHRDMGRQSKIVAYLDSIAATYEAYDLRRLALRFSIPYLARSGQFQTALERCDYLIANCTHQEIEKILLFEKGMICKYGLRNRAAAEAAFGLLIENYPGDALALMAQAEFGPDWSPGGGKSAPREVTESPKDPFLSQCHPNPFSSEVRICYQLPRSTKITVAVYDASGRLVKTLTDGIEEIGYHQRVWQGDDAHGERLPSGVYFVSVVSDRFHSTKKIVLVR